MGGAQEDHRDGVKQGTQACEGQNHVAEGLKFVVPRQPGIDLAEPLLDFLAAQRKGRIIGPRLRRGWVGGGQVEGRRVELGSGVQRR